MSIRLHIERLVADGLLLAPRERRALGNAVEAELTLLLQSRRHPWPQTGLALRDISTKPLRVRTANAASLGAEIAGSISDGIATAVRS